MTALHRTAALAALTALSLLIGCRSPSPSGDLTGGSGDAEALAKAGYRRYGAERGVVEYALTGPQRGTETLAFDHWGLREAKRTNVTLNVDGRERSVDQLMIIDGEWITTINLDTRTGTRVRNRAQIALADQRGSKDIGASALSVLEELGARKSGTESIVGKTCEMWSVASIGSTTCLWNSLPLKTVVQRDGMRVEGVAVSFRENADVDPGAFAIPPDVVMTDP